MIIGTPRMSKRATTRLDETLAVRHVRFVVQGLGGGWRDSFRDGRSDDRFSVFLRVHSSNYTCFLATCCNHALVNIS